MTTAIHPFGPEDIANSTLREATHSDVITAINEYLLSRCVPFARDGYMVVHLDDLDAFIDTWSWANNVNTPLRSMGCLSAWLTTNYSVCWDIEWSENSTTAVLKTKKVVE